MTTHHTLPSPLPKPLNKDLILQSLVNSQEIFESTRTILVLSKLILNLQLHFQNVWNPLTVAHGGEGGGVIGGG